jgi:hypothetical protein
MRFIDKGGRCPPYALIVKCAISKNALRAAFCERGALDCRDPTRRGDTPRLSKHRQSNRSALFITILEVIGLIVRPHVDLLVDRGVEGVGRI